MLTEEQRLLRQNGIGASDIGAIMGFNNYRTALDVYVDKVNPLPKEDPLADNEAIYWGNALEDDVADRYALLNKCELLNFPTTNHPEHKFIMATPDRLIKDSKKGLEIKTAGLHVLDQWKDNQIPKSYVMQVAQCMFVLDYDEWDLAVLFGGQELKVFNFTRDKEFDAIILDACSKFWHSHVLAKEPPTFNIENENALSAIKKLYNKIEATQVELDDELLGWVNTWNKAKEEVKKYEAVVKSAQAHILDKMQNHNTGILPNGELLIRKEVVVKGYTVAPSTYIRLDFKGIKK